MANLTIEFRADFQDSEGERTPLVGYKVFADTVTLAQLKTALAAFCAPLVDLSWANNYECTATMRVINSWGLGSDGGSGTYDDIEDKAFLVFQSAVDGAVYKMSIPAPQDTAFLSDNETVDPTSDAMAALVTYVEANLTGKYGSVDLKYIKGYRKRAKTRRKLRQGIASEIGG